MRFAQFLGAPVGHAPFRSVSRLLGAAALAAAVAMVPMAPAQAETPSFAYSTSVSGAKVDAFYAARGNRPLWLANGNAAAANELVALLGTASLDGLNPAIFDTRKLKAAIASAERGGDAALRADRLLSEALVSYVQALRTVNAARAGWEINDPEAAPRAPDATRILTMAATAPSLASFLKSMPFMHSSYADLRAALASAERTGNSGQASILRANMERVRVLPGADVERYVMVNAAAQRLYMVENGKVVDSMKVVVGKPEMPTPMMAAMIRHTMVNPYWNLPPDLVTERVAPNVIKEGQAYLDKKGYKILSDWSDKASLVSPASIDWAKVAAGKQDLRMRQDPGAANAMGTMKFMFPNPRGVYLHDTPQKDLMGQDSRMFSAGCVRLESAARLGRWLHGKTLTAKGDSAEQRIDLARPVPVYLSYLTAVPSGGKVAYLEDVYSRDGRSDRLAALALR